MDTMHAHNSRWHAGRRRGAVIALLGLLAGCGRTAPATVSNADARNAIASDIIANYLPADSTRELATIYATVHPVAAGIQIWPAFNRTDIQQPPPIYTLSKPSWIFVIDHDSVARFAHPITFIFVPEDGSAYEVHDEEWWPVVEQQNHWYSNGSMSAPTEHIVFEGIVAFDWRAAGRNFP